jgi:hypothetical protein
MRDLTGCYELGWIGSPSAYGAAESQCYRPPPGLLSRGQYTSIRAGVKGGRIGCAFALRAVVTSRKSDQREDCEPVKIIFTRDPSYHHEAILKAMFPQRSH